MWPQCRGDFPPRVKYPSPLLALDRCSVTATRSAVTAQFRVRLSAPVRNPFLARGISFFVGGGVAWCAQCRHQEPSLRMETSRPLLARVLCVCVCAHACMSAYVCLHVCGVCAAFLVIREGGRDQ